MEKYKIKIFPTAQADLNDIVDYLNTLSKETAINYFDLIVEKIRTLEEMPRRLIILCFM